MSEKDFFPCYKFPVKDRCDYKSVYKMHTCGGIAPLTDEPAKSLIKPVELHGGLTEPISFNAGRSYEVKDSGQRKKYMGGMVRDVTTGKSNPALVLDGPMFQRWADHLTKGAVKYEPRNWMKANGPDELNRFRESAVRHFMQWFNGETDEDHAAATFFNINGYEYVKKEMDCGPVIRKLTGEK